MTDQEIIDSLVPTVAKKMAKAIRLIAECRGHLEAIDERLDNGAYWDEEECTKDAAFNCAQVLASMVLFEEDDAETPKEADDDEA